MSAINTSSSVPPLGDDPLDDLSVGLRALLAELAELGAQRPPGALRQRVLDRALSRRRPGAALELSVDDSKDPVEGYRRTATEIAALAATLRDGDWSVETVHGWTVKDTVAHLATVEAWFGSKIGALEFDAAGADERDHLAATRAGMAALANESPQGVVETFRQRSGAVTDALARLEAPRWDAVFPFYAFDAPLGANVVARMFELWIHHEDICRALGRPLVSLDAGRFRMMTTVAAAALPAGIDMAGFQLSGRTARLVLTGPGGGTYVRELGGADAEPGQPVDVTLVADCIEFCRVAARRLPVDDLVLEVDGDVELARKVLVGVSMLAAD